VRLPIWRRDHQRLYRHAQKSGIVAAWEPRVTMRSGAMARTKILRTSPFGLSR